MTTKHVVTTNVREIIDKILFYIERCFEEVPIPRSSYKTYVLESRWSWDGSHREFATICIEPPSSIVFEDILDPLIPEEKKEWILKPLKRIYDAQVPKHGGQKMLRVYRVLGRNLLGYSPGHGLDGTLNSNTVHLNFVLKPLFDFDDMGNPIPCKIEK